MNLNARLLVVRANKNAFRIVFSVFDEQKGDSDYHLSQSSNASFHHKLVYMIAPKIEMNICLCIKLTLIKAITLASVH